MLNPSAVITFSLLYRKYHYWAILVQNLKYGEKGEIWYLDQLEQAKIYSDDDLFFFRLEIPFLGKFAQKSQNYLFKAKLENLNNFHKLNSIVMFTFSAIDWKYSFGVNLIQKFKIVCLR